jgi:hypothetical protein
VSCCLEAAGHALALLQVGDKVSCGSNCISPVLQVQLEADMDCITFKVHYLYACSTIKCAASHGVTYRELRMMQCFPAAYPSGGASDNDAVAPRCAGTVSKQHGYLMGKRVCKPGIMDSAGTG